MNAAISDVLLASSRRAAALRAIRHVLSHDKSTHRFVDWFSRQPRAQASVSRKTPFAAVGTSTKRAGPASSDACSAGAKQCLRKTDLRARRSSVAGAPLIGTRALALGRERARRPRWRLLTGALPARARLAALRAGGVARGLGGAVIVGVVVACFALHERTCDWRRLAARRAARLTGFLPRGGRIGRCECSWLRMSVPSATRSSGCCGWMATRSIWPRMGDGAVGAGRARARRRCARCRVAGGRRAGGLPSSAGRW
jgi:hypothetical protein